MAKPKAPDPVAWAKATPRAHGGVRCATCATPAIVAVLAKWAPLWKSGEIDISSEQATAYLREHHGYAMQAATLRKCLRRDHGVKLRG